MCVGFWCLEHPEYSLVLCSNRDEYLSRPTQAAHWHSFDSLKSPTVSRDIALDIKTISTERENSVLSGIDTAAGGTWFGINKRGEIALLTNITEATVNLPSSRGHLCSSFLLRGITKSNTSLSEYVDELISSETRYAGFNMLLLSPAVYPHASLSPSIETLNEIPKVPLQYDALLVSNGGAGNPIAPVPLSQASFACGGISNNVPKAIDPLTGALVGQDWPKVTQGRELLLNILSKSQCEEELVAELFNMMRNKSHSSPQARYEFRNFITIDPVDFRYLKDLQAFAGTQGQANGTKVAMSGSQAELSLTHPKYYATRLSTVLLVRRNGEVLFVERDMWISGDDDTLQRAEHAVGDSLHERRFRFQL